MSLESVQLIIFCSLMIIGVVVDLSTSHFNQNNKNELARHIKWTLLWISLACVFAIWVALSKGNQKAFEFAAGYLIEESLSIDNIFVFILLFKTFKIPPSLQHRVLFWGIFSALIMRGCLIVVGCELMHRLVGVNYIFGAILIYASWHAFKGQEQDDTHYKSIVEKLNKWIPVSNQCDGDRFLTKMNGSWVATPLLVCLIGIEIADLVFAIDSIPAVLAISSDPFIVFTSNAFAIVGLRSLYFVMRSIMESLQYIHYGIGCILMWVGFKMMTSPFITIPPAFTLVLIFLFLSISSIFSVIYKKDKK